jgi:predicted AAA+ superfamily ATPase
MIYRDIIDRIRPWLSQDTILMLKGARQVGKTTILHYLQKEIEGQGSMARYMRGSRFRGSFFGDPAFSPAPRRSFQGKTGTVLIDEFQSITNAGLFPKRVRSDKRPLPTLSCRDHPAWN